MRPNSIATLIDGFSRPGRELLRKYVPFATFGERAGHGRNPVDEFRILADALLSGRGEASGVAMAADFLALYDRLDDSDKPAFFTLLGERFGTDEHLLAAAWERYQSEGKPALLALARAMEAPRQELFRRLNLAPEGTAALVRMRADMLQHFKDAEPAIEAVDADFVHLLQSWFNRGFLSFRRIDWSSPASLLERVIRYEAVHDISSWAELRRRLDPVDRRCYAFFHRSMPEEPLIFVEVALTKVIPESIQTILDPDREMLQPAETNTAVFYSISNCQAGLRGISFGSFLIKQVAQDLAREMPWLKHFCTLSPVPGLMRYMRSVAGNPADRDMIERLQTGEPMSAAVDAEARDFVLRHAIRYFREARNAAGKPLDPVGRFHLGNGARLERLNWRGDISRNGLMQSGGLMVNYLYDLSRIEEHHEAYAIRGEVLTGLPFKKLEKSPATKGL